MTRSEYSALVHSARRKVTLAIANGVIQKKTICENCGSNYRVAGHHPDYERPLDLQWLCHHCHNAVHGRAKKNAMAGSVARSRGILRANRQQVAMEISKQIEQKGKSPGGRLD